ncbi:MAG: hypothetical protein M3Z37_06925 [Candidatus Eremiobacteraeota bacterium]|nr:hypothetical protein [Candidatus Eremiobacteraeota bacterium]
MVDERSNSRAADGAHSAEARSRVGKAQPCDAAALALFLQTSQQVRSGLGAPAQADLERLLGKADAGVLLVYDALNAPGVRALAPGKFAGALGYSLDAGTLRLFSLTLLTDTDSLVASQAARTLFRAAEDLARALRAAVMAAQVDKRAAVMAAFLDAGFSIDDEEPDTTSDGGVIPVAGVIKLVAPA